MTLPHMAKDDGNTKSKKKDASSASNPSLRRSGRETSSRKEPTSSPSNNRKSERIDKRTSPSPSPVKKKPETIEKQMGPSPLRRSDRGKKQVSPGSPESKKSNIKSKREKTINNSKQSVKDVSEDNPNERQDPDVGGGKRKRVTSRGYKSLFKPQRIRIEADDDKDPEGQDKSPQANTSSTRDVDKDPKSTDKLPLNDNNKSGCSLKDRDDGVGKCNEEAGANSNNHISHTSPSSECKKHKIDETCHACSKEERINHDLDNQQEFNSCDKTCNKDLCTTSYSKVVGSAGVMENAENNDATTLLRKQTSFSISSKFVEFWVPVQISNVQLEQYCATLLSNAMALRSYSKSGAVGALHDILISNRKCCNHPYMAQPSLNKSVTENLEPAKLLDVGIKASGKLQFLDLILPEVKKHQLRVLILFQATVGTGKGASIGDILDDFVHQTFGPDSYERVDGVGIVPSKKQAALNNFNNDKSRFIFLLDHRSCLPSIKLSSIDIIIIFDSDLNPANDLRALHKISIDSQSQQIMIFRLYSTCTLEEKILKLAEDNVVIDGKLHNALLMWGASDLFHKLTGFHNSSVKNISSEESFLKDVVEEFLYLISHKSKSKDTVKSIITRVQTCGNYGKNSETKTQFLEGEEQPRIFWKDLLEGRYPLWEFISGSTSRQRKRPNYFGDSSTGTDAVDADVGKKRRRTVNNTTIEPAALKPVTEGETGGANEGGSGVPADNESGDCFWSIAVGNEVSLHDLLKPTVSELCKVLKFSEDVKTIVEKFLEFVIENYHVSKEHTSTLQAFMISLCWIGSSIAKYKIDKRESFALAKKHLSFSCVEEEAKSVYSKLESAKEAFLQHTENQEIHEDAIKDCTPAPQATFTDSTDPNKKSNEVARPESYELPIEETLQSTEQMLKNDELEIEKFNREWDEKKMNLENDYKVDKALIRTLHSNPSVRSEKLKSLDKEFATKLEEHEKMREIHLNDLKSTLLAAEGQVAANQDSHEAAPTSPQTSRTSEKQMADATVSSVPVGEIQAEMHDDMANDVAGGEAIVSSEQIGESPSEHHHDDMANDVAGGEAIVSSEQIGESPSEHHDDMEHDVAGGEATVSSEQSGEIPSEHHDKMEHDVARGEAMVSSEPVREIPSEHHDDMEIDVARGDEIVSGEPVGEIPSEHHDDMENDVARKVDSVELGVPEAEPNQENAKEGTNSPHVVEDCNETGPDDVAPHVDSAEIGTPAGNCTKENAEDMIISPNTSSAVEDNDDSCGSSSSNSPSAAVSHDNTPSDQPIPTILEIENESLQIQQLPSSEIQDKQGEADPDPNSLPEINVDNLQPVDAGQVGRIIPEDSSPDPHDPPTAEIQSNILPESGLLLETTIEELTLNPLHGGPGQSPENHTNPSDHAMPQSRENLEENQPNLPSSGGTGQSPENHTNPSDHAMPQSSENLEENQPNLPSSDAVHEAPAPPVAAEILNQNTSQPELNLYNVQRFDNHNQVASRQPDPLHVELERLCAVKDNVIKFHEETKQRLKSECDKEIAEMIAQIKAKYEAKGQEAEADFHLKKKELDNNLNKVIMNKILADAFRSKCQDLTTSGHAGLQQASQAGLMQQLQRFSALPSMSRPHGDASSSPGQSSGTRQSTPPLQIVHQQAALFSSTPNRLPPNTNLRSSPPNNVNRLTPNSMSNRPLPNINPAIPTTTPPSPPVVNQTTPSTTATRQPPPPTVNSNNPSTTPTRAPPGFNPNTPSSNLSRLPAGINPNTPSSNLSRLPDGINLNAPSSNLSRLPAGINPINPSSTPSRLAPNINNIAMSAANLRISTETRASSPLIIRPLSNGDIRGPAPHFRPLVNSDVRAPAPHIRPFRPSTPSSLPRIPSIPTSQTSHFRPENVGPPLPTNIPPSQSNLGSEIDSLDLTGFLQEGGGSAHSSGHDLVYLSDDD